MINWGKITSYFVENICTLITIVFIIKIDFISRTILMLLNCTILRGCL